MNSMTSAYLPTPSVDEFASEGDTSRAQYSAYATPYYPQQECIQEEQSTSVNGWIFTQQQHENQLPFAPVGLPVTFGQLPQLDNTPTPTQAGNDIRKGLDEDNARLRTLAQEFAQPTPSIYLGSKDDGSQHGDQNDEEQGRKDGSPVRTPQVMDRRRPGTPRKPMVELRPFDLQRLDRRIDLKYRGMLKDMNALRIKNVELENAQRTYQAKVEHLETVVNGLQGLQLEEYDSGFEEGNE